MKALFQFAAFGLLATSALAQETKPEPTPEKEAAKPAEEVTVVMKTSMGDIHIEMDSKNSPITVKNFLSYVDAKHYDNTVFHRVISTFMIQGGGFEIKDGTQVRKQTKAPIKNESESSKPNKRGTLAMARTPDLNSATDQFFINVGDNPGLNHGGPYGGYATFAKVIKGMDVVDKIKDVETTWLGREKAKPVEPIIIKSIRRTADKIEEAPANKTSSEDASAETSEKP